MKVQETVWIFSHSLHLRHGDNEAQTEPSPTYWKFTASSPDSRTTVPTHTPHELNEGLGLCPFRCPDSITNEMLF